MKINAFSLAIAGLIVVALAGWGWFHTRRPTPSQPTPTLINQEPVVTTGQEQEEGASMPTSQTLVIYFSRADENYGVGTVERGNTALLAEAAVAATGADSFEIIPVAAYPAQYQAATEVAKTEQETAARPTYQGDIDLSPYQTILLGYPIWWGDLPMIVYTFLENHDFTGKTVYLFNTHEGSGAAGTYQTVADLLPTAQVNTNGFAITGQTARTPAGAAELTAWLIGLGLTTGD